MSLFHMDDKSNKFLHDYSQLLTKNFIPTPQPQFSFAVGIDTGSNPPDEDNDDIVTCNIISMTLNARRDGKAGKDVVLTFNAFFEGVKENHLACVYQVDPAKLAENRNETFLETVLGLPGSNEVILGHFEKLTIPSIAAFNELRNEIAESGFYLYRDGFTPPADEDEENDDD